MYSSDKPITSEEEDLLGRASFAKQLGKAIVSDYSHDNIVIGLFGKWGSGKTSIINLAIREINRMTDSFGEDSKPIVMKFSPWNFTDSDNLISQFFVELRNVLERKDSNKVLNGIGQLLENYSDAFDLFEFLPGGKFYGPLAKSTAKEIAERLQNKASSRSIEDIKKKLEQALASQNHRIIVVIDDIDRLTNEQIRTVFQLVKQVAGLPNITYLLSMDREIVIGALESIQKCDGNEYLEKIVQIPFDIPQIDSERVQTLLLTKLDMLLEEYPNEVFDLNHWQRVYSYCVKPFVKSVRDVNRLTNVFRFKYSLLHNEVNYEDLLALTTFSLYLPDLFSWISQNEQLLCEGRDGYKFLAHDQPKNNEQYFTGVFKSLGIAADQGLNLLSTLFPIVSKLTGKGSYDMSDRTDYELRKYLRVASTERFDLYFQLDLSQISVGRETITRFALEMNRQEVLDLINILNNEGKMPFFLEEFQERISQIPENRIRMLVEAFIEKKDSLKGERQSLLFAISSSKRAEFCIEQLFIALPSHDTVFDIVHKILLEGTKESVSGITEFIYEQEVVHGRIGEDRVQNEKCLVSDEQLNSIEADLVKRYERLTESGELFLLSNMDYISFIWMKLNKESYDEYFKESMKECINILHFISSVSGKWRSGTGIQNIGWSITYESIKEFVEPNRGIYDEIKNLDKKVLLNLFNETELEKIATFLLNEGHNKEFDHKASIEAARDLIRQWKSENTTIE